MMIASVALTRQRQSENRIVQCKGPTRIHAMKNMKSKKRMIASVALTRQSVDSLMGLVVDGPPANSPQIHIIRVEHPPC